MEKVTLTTLQQAYQSKDPDFARLFVQLVTQDPQPEIPVREGLYTYGDLEKEIKHSRNFRHKKKVERDHYWQEKLKSLENSEVPLPDRLQTHQLLMQLWQNNTSYDRDCLLRIIAEVPLCWGPWKALKKIFKEAEAAHDSEIFGALGARFDQELAQYTRGRSEVSKHTLLYLARRTWRYYRRLAQTLPANYLDEIYYLLKFYNNQTPWAFTWVANHVFYHESGKYTRRRFKLGYRKMSFLKNRAFGELWQRSPRPLFQLLENAQADQVRSHCMEALKNDFPTKLREIEPAWVIRLLNIRNQLLDEFVVWLLQNVSQFEQSSFRELGLHQPVLQLFFSSSSLAQEYAINYTRAYARDVDASFLIRLVTVQHKAVTKLALDLIQDRDPKKEIGLEVWGKLLELPASHELAAKNLRTHFGPKELTTDWFRSRFLCSETLSFVRENFLPIHPLKTLSPEYFYELMASDSLESSSAHLVLEMLEKFPAKEIDKEFIRVQLLNPLVKYRIYQWISQEKIPVKELGVDYLKTLAFHISWQESSWVESLHNSSLPWQRELEFDPQVAQWARMWLSDVRIFTPQEIGFSWLMQLVKRSENHYHDFAREYMIKAFSPADFAAKTQSKEKSSEASKQQEIDLQGQTFLFTGKLKTMTRSQATKKVTQAKGKNASGVTGNLDYLVIGDEGSPLYGQGRKGSKQVKAEKLASQGAKIKIISETAFLQMLAGKQTQVTEEDASKGCGVLWSYLAPQQSEETPLATFAREYLRRHHPDISLETTDRPVDPGMEIPPAFLTFAKAQELLASPRKPVRKLGVEFCSWELARWQPKLEQILTTCEEPHPEGKEFFHSALLSPDKVRPKAQLDPEKWQPESVYRFCESLDEKARAIGMGLIEKYPSLAIPEELFRLSESPDRRVIAFVVKSLWTLYRDRGIYLQWQPRGKDNWQIQWAKDRPASQESLYQFLRFTLFRVPPGRFPKDFPQMDVTYLPSRRVKLLLIEAIRDMALEDEQFAQAVTPLFEEFILSQGESERKACLVALVRIYQQFHQTFSNPKLQFV